MQAFARAAVALEMMGRLPEAIEFFSFVLERFVLDAVVADKVRFSLVMALQRRASVTFTANRLVVFKLITLNQ